MKDILLRPMLMPILIVGLACGLSAATPPTQAGPAPVWTLVSMLAFLAAALIVLYLPYVLKGSRNHPSVMAFTLNGVVTLLAIMCVTFSIDLLDDLIARMPGMPVEIRPLGLTPNELSWYWLVGTTALLMAAMMIGLLRTRVAQEVSA